MKPFFLAIIVGGLCVSSTFAELWEDYAPSEAVTELTVVAVEPNYLDDYIVRLERTWVRAAEVQKELGYITNYAVWVSNNADSPNVWLTMTYPNLASMTPDEKRWNKVNEELEKRYGDDEDELEEIAKGYEEIRSIVDHAILNQVEYR